MVTIIIALFVTKVYFFPVHTGFVSVPDAKIVHTLLTSMLEKCLLFYKNDFKFACLILILAQETEGWNLVTIYLELTCIGLISCNLSIPPVPLPVAVLRG